MKKIWNVITVLVGIILLALSAAYAISYYTIDSHGLYICVAIGAALIASLVCFFISAKKYGLDFTTGRMAKVMAISLLSVFVYNVIKSVIFSMVTSHYSDFSVDFMDALFYNGGADMVYFVNHLSDLMTTNASEQLLMRMPVLVYCESIFELFALYALIGELTDDNQSIFRAFRKAIFGKLGFIPVIMFAMRMITIASNESDSVVLKGFVSVYPLVFLLSLLGELLEYSPVALIHIIPLCMLRDAISNFYADSAQNSGVTAVIVLAFSVFAYFFWAYWLSSAMDDYCNENRDSVGERILSFSVGDLLHYAVAVVEHLAVMAIGACTIAFAGSEEIIEDVDNAIFGRDDDETYYP